MDEAHHAGGVISWMSDTARTGCSNSWPVLREDQGLRIARGVYTS